MRLIHKIAILIQVMFVLVLLCSCSSSNPVNPGSLEYNADTGQVPVFVSTRDTQGHPMDGMGVLGLFTLNIQTDPLSVEMTPVRKSNLVDSLEVMDITNFMSLAPCSDCIRMKSVGLNDNDQLVLEIGIRHPFDKGTPTEPISGKNRIDLHIFNVEGIMAISKNTAGTQNFITDSSKISKTLLANASGYTSYLDEYLDNVVETDATMHPYILHFRDYTSGNYSPGFNETGFLDVYNPWGNLIMAQGCDYDFREYIIDIQPGLNYEFLYAVSGCYGVSTESFLDRFIPEYRIPQYNKKAASEVFVDVVDNNMMDGNTLGTAMIRIKVLDMNHGVEVSAFINKMSNDSSVSRITIDVPDIMAGAVVIDDTSTVFIGGVGRDPLVPLTYDIAVTNELGASAGTYLGMVAVEDSFPTSTNTHPFIAGRDGGFRVQPGYSALTGLFNIDKFVTYQVFEYDVLEAMVFVDKTLMPTARQYSGAAVVGDIIYVIGGTTGLSPVDPRSGKIEAYNASLNTWDITLTDMPTPRAGMAVESVGTNIYVIGGMLSTGNGYTNIMEIYDTLTDTWSDGTAILGPFRHGMGSCVKDDIIYVAGGYNLTEKELKTMYRYNSTNPGWGVLPEMAAARTQFAMTINGDNIFVIGGNPVVGPGSELTPYLEIFDTVGTTWSVPTSNPSIIDFAPGPETGLLGTQFATINDSVVLMGGAYNLDKLEGNAFLYDETGESFTQIGMLAIPRASFSYAVWSNQIYLFGGIALSNVAPFDPFLTPSVEEGTW